MQMLINKPQDDIKRRSIHVVTLLELVKIAIEQGKPIAFSVLELLSLQLNQLASDAQVYNSGIE